MQQNGQVAKNMSRSLKFPRILADENVKKKLVIHFLSSGCDIVYEEKGLKNSALINFAKKDKRVLLTNDHDFLNDSLYPPEKYEGIIVLHVHPPYLFKQIEALENLFSLHAPEKITGKLFIVGEEGEIEKN